MTPTHIPFPRTESFMTIFGYGYFQFIMGTFRSNSSGNWSTYNTSTHASVGTGPLVQNSDHLSIPFDVSNTKMLTMGAWPDEDMARAGYSAGASGGVTALNIYFGKNGVPKDPSQVVGSTLNFQILVIGYVAEEEPQG